MVAHWSVIIWRPKQHIPNVDSRVAAIFCRGEPIGTGDTVIEANDEVFFIAERNDITKLSRSYNDSKIHTRKS